jgi:ABC-type antimicrobial peptide transport system permease subunit
MTVQLELWHLITLAITVLGAFAGIGKTLAAQTLHHLDDRFVAQEETRRLNHEALKTRLAAIEATAREEAGQWQRVEREILQIKADMPLNYVRREDYIRGQSVIEAKLDGLAAKTENVVMRIANAGAIATIAQAGHHHAA